VVAMDSFEFTPSIILPADVTEPNSSPVNAFYSIFNYWIPDSAGMTNGSKLITKNLFLSSHL